MWHTPLTPPPAPVGALSPTPTHPFNIDDLERRVARSTVFAWLLITGLPVLGTVAALRLQLPLFACLMAGGFLLAVCSVARRALATFTSKTLRLLVAARLTIVLVVGGLLFCTSGSAWVAVVSAVLLWLSADRLLGRRALVDLFKLVKS